MTFIKLWRQQFDTDALAKMLFQVWDCVSQYAPFRSVLAFASVNRELRDACRQFRGAIEQRVRAADTLHSLLQCNYSKDMMRDVCGRVHTDQSKQRCFRYWSSRIYPTAPKAKPYHPRDVFQHKRRILVMLHIQRSVRLERYQFALAMHHADAPRSSLTRSKTFFG